MVPSSFLTIRDHLSRRSPRTIAEPNTIEAAVAVVLVPGAGGEIEILLIKRSEHRGDPWSGQMALPGGRRETQDRDLLETARRETHEETDIVLPADALLGQLDDLHPRTRVLPPIVVRPFVFGLQQRPGVTLSAEVALYLWIPARTLRASADESEIDILGELWAVPSYLVGPHVVWGMTHRILSPFLQLIP